MADDEPFDFDAAMHDPQLPLTVRSLVFCERARGGRLTKLVVIDDVLALIQRLREQATDENPLDALERWAVGMIGEVVDPTLVREIEELR